MKKIIILAYILCAGVWTGHAQVRIANSSTNLAVQDSPAFIDASSNPVMNGSANVGKGLIWPRVDLSAMTAFPSVSAGVPASFPTRFDGMIVYNIATSGTAGVGSTEGTLSPGFWYYENKSASNTGGTWRPLRSNAADADGIVGNEVTNATAGGGLVRAGSGTAAAPYTLGIADVGVTTAKIADNAVTTAKIADGAVGTADLAANAVTNAKIATGVVDSVKIAANAIRTIHILNDAVTTPKIAPGAVRSTEILDATIVAADLADNAVATAKIANSAVSNAKIATGAVDSIKIAANAIRTTHILNAAVTSSKIANNAIVRDRIADKAVASSKISDMGATAGQVLKHNGTNWVPAAPDVYNGLHISGTNVGLGGTLTTATRINQAEFDLWTIGTGKVSIGALPNANSAKFEVNGAATNTATSITSGRIIDFSKSNLAACTASPGAGEFQLINLKDGGVYSLWLSDQTSGTSTFTATNTAGASLAVLYANKMPTIQGTRTLYTIIVIGTAACVTMTPGFKY